MKQLKKLALALVIASVSLGASAERVSLSPYVQHYSEWNTSENPRLEYWCAHAALKMFVQYKMGQTYSLNYIRWNVFPGSSGYNSKRCPYASNSPPRLSTDGFCGDINDILYGAKQLGIASVFMKNVPQVVSGKPNYQGVLDAIKMGTKDRKSPLIVFGDFEVLNPSPSYGHAWVIVGYNTDGATNPKDAYVFLRNSGRTSTDPEMDDWVKVERFYTMMQHSHSATNPNFNFVMY